MNRTALAEWGCIVSGLVAIGTAIVWAFRIQPKGIAISWFPLFSIIAALICAALFYLGKRLPTAGSTVPAARPQAKAQEAAREPDSLCEALKKIASEDAAKLPERVRTESQRIEFHFMPGSDPYLDIITELWNGTVFELTSFGEISGHATYAGRQLAAEPRVIAAIEPVLIRIKHSEPGVLVVRQFVSTEVADSMEANRNRNVVADFESVSVLFKMIPLPGLPIQEYRWWGPRFTIDEATRV